MKALVTGSGGLIGSACVGFLAEQGWDVVGLDNDMRREFFGEKGSTGPIVESLRASFPNYRHRALDIRDREGVREVFRDERPDFIIHTAGQPSHDKAASIPYDDFDVNAVGTLNLLVATRDFCRDSPFCFTSTNKVYGDRPNELPLRESASRYDYADGRDGIDESMSIDACLHSLFGASKVAADVMCQEFGRYFDMPARRRRSCHHVDRRGQRGRRRGGDETRRAGLHVQGFAGAGNGYRQGSRPSRLQRGRQSLAGPPTTRETAGTGKLRLRGRP